MTITSVRVARRAPRTLKVCALIVVCGLAVVAFDGHYRFFDMVIYHDAIRWAVPRSASPTRSGPRATA